MGMPHSQTATRTGKVVRHPSVSRLLGKIRGRRRGWGRNWVPRSRGGGAKIRVLLGAESRFEFHVSLQDPLLSQIIKSLVHEVEGGFADRILVESLGTALCIRIARCFVGQLQLPTSEGLSPERSRRVRDYIEDHLDEDLSLTILADIACLSPYHYSKQVRLLLACAIGIAIAAPPKSLINWRAPHAPRHQTKIRSKCSNWVDSGPSPERAATAALRRKPSFAPA
jgi:hypothetical protein